MPMMALSVIRDLGKETNLTGLEIAAETRGRLEVLFPQSDFRVQTSVLYPMLEHFRAKKWVTRTDESNYTISSSGEATLKKWIASLGEFAKFIRVKEAP